tara:strand:- start:526 stop:2115 length:1590 start_codon:yes stop_codon:yes gene_type:complete
MFYKENLVNKFNFLRILFNLFILSYFILSIILSLNVGLTHDENHHDLVWQINKKIYSNYFFGSNFEINFQDYGMNFYGIGFQIFSYPIEKSLEFIFSILSINFHPLLLKHPSIVTLFFISGIYYKKILNIFNIDKKYIYLSLIFYLLYPYLIGHSYFNTLDIPFMSVWLICTYYSLKIVKFFIKKNELNNKDFLILSILTAFLLSIRIAGILIFIQYLLLLIITMNIFKINFFEFLIKIYKSILLFLLFFILFFYLFHPNYWSDPLLIFDSIKYMSNHIQTVCTLTLGECMKAQDLPPTYIPIWLLFKLPIIVLTGLALFPFIEKKIFSNKLNIITLGSLILSTFFIIFSLILLKVNLYDELRQLLFLIPILLIISLISIYIFNKKIAYIGLVIFSLFFIFQNLKIYPYNYIWLNNLSLLSKINGVFELDYWGVSNKKIANFLYTNGYNNECIISNTNNRIDIFLNSKKKCFKNFSQLHKKNERPFYAILTERALNKGVPNNCKNLYNETININFFSEEITLAKIFKCN